MKNIKNLLLTAMALMVLGTFGSCTNKIEEYTPYQINRFEDNPYLAEIWWGEDFDFEATKEVLKNKYNAPAEGGGCSSWHKDNFHGRNIDWTMRDFATIIIHMPKSEKVKYASVGLVAGNPVATKDFLDQNTTVPENLRDVLATSIVDGVNECGVAINHNIVPYDGKAYESDGDITSVVVCRYVLDNCATAKEAVELLRSTKVTQAVVKLANDYSHFFISDPNSSYVVEWIDKEFVATEFKADGKGNFLSTEKQQPAIMTNYFVGMAEKYGFKTNEFFKNHAAGAGIERAETIMNMLDSAKTVNDHLDICKAVWFRLFCQGKSEWYTENAGLYGYDETKGKAWWSNADKSVTHWMSDDDVYAAAQELFRSEVMTNYNNDFNTNWDKIDSQNTYWFTQHSVVYDLKACKGYIIMQEALSSPEIIEVSVK